MLTLEHAIKKHLDSHQTSGVDWPVGATHSVSYCTSTLHRGWSNENTVRFFNSEKELRAWHTKMLRWSRLEENYFLFTCFVWDQGPVELDKFEFFA